MNRYNGINDELVQAVAGDNLSDLVLDPKSIIMVAGVGGAGGNAVNHMQEMGITGVNFVVCNTDAQALNNCSVENKIQMGPGLGAGNNPERGRELAVESEEQLRSLLETSGAKMLFIAAGMGGGTGTGASPVLARIAHELGILTVAVVTMPLRMEGPGRYDQAAKGIEELNRYVDSLLIIDNEKVRQMYGKLPIKQAFGKADDVLGMATKGIAELITVEFALVRVDFADVEKVMRGSGRAHMSVVTGSGESRAVQVAEGSLSSTLLDDNMITGAKDILLSFAVSDINLLTQEDVAIAMEYIQKHASYTDEDGNVHMANIIWGASEKKSLGEDELELVVVATGFVDGDKLNISSSFTESVDHSFPSQDKPEVPPVIPPKPVPPIEQPKRTVSEIPSIMPSQNRYAQINIQLRTPAITRRNVSFVAESSTQARTIFRPMQRESVPDTQPTEQQQTTMGELF